MQNMNSVRTLAVLGAVAGLTGLASAADYDEAINGDIAGLSAGGTMINLDVGVNSVSGTVGPPDTEDFVTFTIGAGQALASVIITDVQFVGGNTSTGFRLYTDQGSGFFQASSGSFNASAVGSDYLTIWDLDDVGGSAPSARASTASCSTSSAPVARSTASTSSSSPPPPPPPSWASAAWR
jgi:hypothetical protein